MLNKGPKTEKGKTRKAVTGDGRRRTPGEELAHSLRETDKTIRKTMREVTEAMRVPSGKSKKKKATQKK
jgi:hypothetical protein